MKIEQRIMKVEGLTHPSLPSQEGKLLVLSCKDVNTTSPDKNSIPAVILNLIQDLWQIKMLKRTQQNEIRTKLSNHTLAIIKTAV